ncbi:MAG: response regulator [Gammaproteobacteria bacterium]|nr:response regulator [Gammaproteobacteria bacterium]
MDAVQYAVQVAQLEEQIKKLFRSERRLYELQGDLDRQFERINALNRFGLRAFHSHDLVEVLQHGIEFMAHDYVIDYAVGLVYDKIEKQADILSKYTRGKKVEGVNIALKKGRGQAAISFDADVRLIIVEGDLAGKDEHDRAFVSRCFKQTFNKTIANVKSRILILYFSFENSRRDIILLLQSPFPEKLSQIERVPSYEDYPFINLFYQHFAGMLYNAIYHERMQEVATELEMRVEERTQELRTSNKKLEDAILESKEAQKKLIESQKLESIGKLAGGIAHDFNNILSSILGYASLIRSDLVGNEEVLKKIDIMQRSAERGALLTSQLLGFARKGKYQKTDIDVNSLVEELCDILQGSLNKNIEISKNIEKNLWSVQGDASQLLQIIMNVAINARDAMPKGGKLDLMTENIVADQEFCRTHPTLKPGYYVRVSIVDTGTGIPLEIQAKVFDPFFTTKAQGEGAGLGLSVVYGIVQNHGGDISIYSEPGEGTRVNIYFPAAGEVSSNKNACALDSSDIPEGTLPALLKGKKILIVDDEETVRELLQDVLASEEVKHYTAAGGHQALDIFKKNKKDIALVILDLIMPDMEGIAVLHKLRAMRKNTLVVLSSGYTENEEIRELRKLPTVEFLQKPYTKNKLLNKIYALIKAQRKK